MPKRKILINKSRYICTPFFELLILLVLLLSVTACSVSIYPNTHLGTSVQPIQISPTQPSGSWENAEIEVLFQQQVIDGSFLLQGNLTFSDAIIQSYPVIRYFFLYLNILDEEKRVISRHSISVNYRSFQFSEQQYPILINIMLPNQADSFTFSYRGEFADYGEAYPDTNYIAY